MTSIRSFSEILQADSLSDGERERYADIIHGESLRLTRLLDDLLDLSVLENGQVVLHESEVRLREVLDRALASSAKITGGMVIERVPEEEEITLTTDADRLAQVFINLISNAAKYGDATHPHLRIVVRETDGGIEATFVDNGTGIPPEARETIFEKFTRQTDRASAGSAGLGLAICREVMGRLGGTVACVDHPDGTAFRVTLPSKRVAKAAAE